MRPIDGEELLERVNFILLRIKSPELVTVFLFLKEYLEKAQILSLDDLRPHGRWGDYEPYPDGYRCSHCKLMHRSCTAYCPNCGAKMDKEGEA